MSVLRPLAVAALMFLFATSATAAGLEPYSGPALQDFALKDLDGKAHKLSDYSGRVVLVNFWATWCPPCVHEMPSMQRLHLKLAKRPFEVVAVNMGEDEATIREFLGKMKVDFTILLDADGSLMKDWRVFAFPTSFLVDGQGVARYALFGPIEWDDPEVLKQIEGLLEGG
jgi:thiol-disulfide isomerase/thioredoxin